VTAKTAPTVVVDTSAAVAILHAEPGSDELIEALEMAPARLISAATRVELGIVIEARHPGTGSDVVARFLRDADISIEPVSIEDAERAISGWRRYGKGRHRAGLNLGDCFTYALAERTGHPILCTGADFTHTDVDVITPVRATSALSPRNQQRRRRGP
jgi:ribonuclease VapC